MAQDDESLLDALKKMEGILTFDDLVDLIAEELSDLSHLVSREQKREREAKPSIAR